MKSQFPDESPFDLESAIAIWRADLKSRNVRKGSIEELERHLRDAFGHRMAENAQTDLSLVWEEVVADLGSPRNLADEFGKNGRLAIGDHLVLATLGLGRDTGSDPIPVDLGSPALGDRRLQGTYPGD